MNVQQAIQELQTLDIQNPGAWPAWIRITAVILTAVILIGGGTYFFIKPVYEQLGQEQGKERALRDEFETKQKKVAALDAFREQLREMEKSFGAMLKQLPSKTEVANLLNDISQTRVASSLEEELFEPQSEQPKEFYAVIPNKIIVLGDYHEMGTFVSGVAALPRIVTIEDVDIKPVPDKRGAGGATVPRGQLRMQALAKTYRYLEGEEAEAAAAAAKPKKPGSKGAKK
jgi:type IV pilus assembly protein PilO